MNFFYSLQIALDNLRSNKLRSALTMLGIIIGVSAVIIMVAILQGASKRITDEFAKMGSNLIFVVYAPTSEESKMASRRIDGLTMDDVNAIAAHCNLVTRLSPELPLENATAQSGGKDMTCSAAGVYPAYADLRNIHIARGRFVSDGDIHDWSKVCVIGEKVREKFFPTGEALGQAIEINGMNLTVVGILTPKGHTFEGDADKKVFLPLTTVQKRMLGTDAVGTLYAEPKTLAQVDAAKDQIWQFLMQRYNNMPGWQIDSFDNILNSIKQVLAIFTIVMGSIAGLALLVGGIGIMNIMLVSVTERTREIGLRKAIGAKRKDILTQFLIESATISGVGGLTGAAIGTGMAYFIGFVTTFIPSLENKQSGTKGMAMYVPIPVVIGAFAFSAFVGVFFGIYPAIRASRLNPIEALRHE